MNQKHFTTNHFKRERLKSVLAALFLLAVIAAWVVTLNTEKPRQSYDVSYPMANAHVSWLQTFRGGAPNEAGR